MMIDPSGKGLRRGLMAAFILAAAAGAVRLSMAMKDGAASFQRQDYCAANRDRNTEAGEALLHGLPHRVLSWSMPAYSVANALICHSSRGGGGLAFPAAALGLTAALVAGMGRLAAGWLGGVLALGAYCFFASFFKGPADGFLGDRWFYQAVIALVGFAAAWKAKTKDRTAAGALGLSMGISLVTLSPLLFYPALCAGWELLCAKERRKAVLTAALLVGIPLLMLSPWVYLNARVLGRFVFLEDGRANTNIMAGAAGVVAGPVMVDARTLIGASPEEGAVPAAAAGVRAHPLRFLKAVLKRTLHVLQESPIPFALALVGAVFGWRDPAVRSLSGLTAYYCGIHLLMPIERRYLFPILPILAVLSAAGLTRFSPAGTCSLWPRRWFLLFGGPVIVIASLALALCLVFPARASHLDALARELRLHPADSWLWAYQGRSLFAQNNPRAAEAALRSYAVLDPGSRDAALLLASAVAINGVNCRQSEVLPAQAAILQPGDMARVAILCHLAKDQIRAARQQLEKLRRMDEDDIESFGGVNAREWSKVLMVRKNLETTMLLLDWPLPLRRRAALNMKLHAPELLPFGNMLDQSGRARREPASPLVPPAPLDPEAFLDLPPSPGELASLAAAALVEEGIVHFRAGRRAQAERSFRRAIHGDRSSISAWMSLGTVLGASGRHNAALSCYDRILRLNPGPSDMRADTLAARANALAALGRAELARRDRRQALRVASPSWPWRQALD